MSDNPTPTTTPRRRSRLARAALVAGLGLGTVAATGAVLVSPAAAQATDDGAGQDELGPRLERACLRIPNLQLRTDRIIDRIQGDADTLGSLAWLDRRIANATERGFDDLAEVLTNRRAVREAAVPVLEQRQVLLDQLAGLCRDHGVDL